MIPIELGWAGRAILGTLFIIPSWIAIDFFKRNFGVSPEIFLVWYFFGTILSTGAVLSLQRVSLVRSGIVLIAIIIGLGLTMGRLANVLLFTAAAKVPNPGLAVAISSTASAVIIFFSFVLWRVFPDYFSRPQLDLDHLWGVILIIIGMYLVVKPR